MEDDTAWLTKKELLLINKKHAKLEQTLGGIRDMSGTPDLLFVLDVNIDRIAVLEAVRRKIPVVGILDSNSIPEGVSYPIPGNDDSVKAISFYLDLIVASILEGLSKSLSMDKMKERGDAPIEVSRRNITARSDADITRDFHQSSIDAEKVQGSFSTPNPEVLSSSSGDQNVSVNPTDSMAPPS